MVAPRVSIQAQDFDLGAEVAPGLYECELNHLHDREWARSADDVLWRRTQLGLHLSPAQRDQVAQWWAARFGAPSAALAQPADVTG